MRLAFSTLGVPGLPVEQVVGLAREHGFHGVELRADRDEEPVHAGLDGDARARVREVFGAAGVEILCVAAYTRVAAPGADDPVVEDLRRQVGLAGDLGAPFVRVFPGGSGPQDDAVAARRLAAAAPYAAERGVRVLVETHDSHRTAADLARVLGPVGHRAVGALWDVLHTWRGGEEPAASYPALAPYLGYVQVKDVASAEELTPLPLGRGVVPLDGCVEVLSREGWDGWLCWEYEKRWYPQAAGLPGLLDAGREHLMRLLGEFA